MSVENPSPRPTPTRRDFLLQSGGGFGGIALASMLGAQKTSAESGLHAAANPLAPRPAHFAPRAKRVIHLFMHGGPSHMDLWDPKPDLIKYAGKPIPESFGPVMTRRAVGKNTLLAPLKPFRKRGQSGLEISDFLPHMSALADEFCVLRSCHGDSVNHPQSVYQMNTGSILMGKPSVGAWVAYGLGTENQSMPAYVVMPDPTSGPKGGPPAWGNGYLPATYQGTTMRPGENPILNLKPQKQISAAQQRSTLDLVRKLNAGHLRQRDFDDELNARVQAYELAFRMQSAAPELLDLSGESKATLDAYGLNREEVDASGKPGGPGFMGSFARNCLLARRMVERGVRFVTCFLSTWDHHSYLDSGLAYNCKISDQPVAALLKDLKARGMLDDTLVVWGGEFGRTPLGENRVNFKTITGRDHHPYGFTKWLAGGGVPGGQVIGATDEIGWSATEEKVHVHDLHATILHQFGLDHERLTYRFQGRDFRITDVHGNVVDKLTG